jgi:uncharacterized protein YaiI (UPF0178 family)
MRILVDADACPVKSIIVNVAKKYNMDVIMFCNTSHIIKDNYSKIIIVDNDREAVDIKLINYLKNNDLVVTQDYGVASMALGKNSKVINQNGFIYTKENIDKLMFERFLSQKNRKIGKKVKSIKKRTKNKDLDFEKTLTNILETNNNS